MKPTFPGRPGIGADDKAFFGCVKVQETIVAAGTFVQARDKPAGKASWLDFLHRIATRYGRLAIDFSITAAVAGAAPPASDCDTHSLSMFFRRRFSLRWRVNCSTRASHSRAWARAAPHSLSNASEAGG
jgi:hypothetical protein